jgi:hypothetical protein
MVHAVNETTGRNVIVVFVEDDEYMRRNFQNDEGDKSEASPLTSHPSPARQGTSGDRPPSEGGQVYSQDSRKATVSPLMSELLGREAKGGVQMVKELLSNDPDYTWHQNYARKD